MARTLARRLAEAGRIRIGDQAETANGKRRPRKLDVFRLTSENPAALNIAASLYGGTPQEWKQEGQAQRQWELYTEANSLDVIVPLQQAIAPMYEQWERGYCTRRCDGCTILASPYQEELIGTPCACEDNPQAPCKLCVRFHVMLPDIAGMGLWRLETHGYYTATELLGTMEILRMSMPGHALLEAVMTLATRTRKVIAKNEKTGEAGPQTRHFPVVGIQPKFTPRQLAMGIQAPQAQIPESQKSLEEHVADIWGDEMSEAAEPTEAPMQEIVQEEPEAKKPDPSQDHTYWSSTAMAVVGTMRDLYVAGQLDAKAQELLSALRQALDSPDKSTQGQKFMILKKVQDYLKANPPVNLVTGEVIEETLPF